jgi:sugar lactone lactonase YvrE
MKSKDVICIHSGICHLGEGPVWNEEYQKLYWTDIYNRQIWMYDPQEKTSRIFWKGDYQTGGFAFTRSKGIVLCTDKGVFKMSIGADGLPGNKPELLFRIPMAANEMFNDITVDPEGRIFAGTILRPDMAGGTLYRFEKGKSPVTVMKNLHCSNGMTFSMDEKFFFHTDSRPKTITRYDYDRKTGEINNPKVYFQGTPEMGSPDGITLDSMGNIWAAFWGGGCVRRIDTDGRIAEEIEVPAKQPSSVMFGGGNLDKLYITSACENADDIISGRNEDGTFLGGPVYMCTPGVIGRAEWLADF